ncbi:MAG: ribonuclease HII [Lactobacillaceae bacterium]|jgi:ribonuclease HII|nr:ribonuclease HII [Lactobacillaceae bacterium]
MKISDIVSGYKDRFLFEEKTGSNLVAGIDEVGRGALAGPVVSAAVILNRQVDIPLLFDSKQLSQKNREMLYQEIVESALSWNVAIVDAEIVDEIDVYRASKKAMLEAMNGLSTRPEYLLIDAMEIDTDIPQEKIIKGDTQSNSIAAASIVAKVTRDKIMSEFAEVYPEYGFLKNVGYGTKTHLEALQKYGPTPIHRKTFAPVKNLQS